MASSSSLQVACPGGGSCSTLIPKVAANSHQLQTILQIVFGIIAVLAVLYIVINAFRLVISQGEPESVKKARGAIIAAVIGLVVAVSAEIIVSFVLGQL